MDSAVIVSAIGAVPLTIAALGGLAATRRAALQKAAKDRAEKTAKEEQERRELAEAQRTQRDQFIEQQATALADERRENARLRAELAEARRDHP